MRTHFKPWGLKLVLATVVVSLLAVRVHAADFDPAKLGRLRSTLQGFVDKNVVAGAVAAVGTHRGLVAIEAVGQQNREQNLPMRPNATFRIASMTKPITALAIMILVDEGKLSVEDPVEKHLQEFKGQMIVSSRDPDAGTVTLKKPTRPITVRDLLTHTSGLPGGFPEGISDLYFRRHLTLGEAVATSSQRPLDFEPGSKWAYCNAGIDTLGRIVEVVSGESFEQFLERHLFRPLGMSDTTFYPSDEQVARLAGLYDLKEGQLRPVGYQLLGPTKSARHPIPAGGLYSTAEDLAKLYQLMLLRGAIGELRIVSEKSVADMTRNQTGNLTAGFTPNVGMGFGWQVTRQPDGVHAMLSAGSYGHGGAFGTQGWIDPTKDLYIILLIQRVGMANGDASDIRRDVQQVIVDAIK
ncbi:MAG: beta-lactamase family protein [Planctomycetes bacterium]|nr:beta-lactamase family protein [Planctomycetota bacterium]